MKTIKCKRTLRACYFSCKIERKTYIHLFIIRRRKERNRKDEPENSKFGYLQGVVGGRDKWVRRTVGGRDTSLSRIYLFV